MKPYISKNWSGCEEISVGVFILDDKLHPRRGRSAVTDYMDRWTRESSTHKQEVSVCRLLTPAHQSGCSSEYEVQADWKDFITPPRAQLLDIGFELRMLTRPGLESN